MEDYSPGAADICQKGSPSTKPLPAFTIRLSWSRFLISI